MVKGYSRGNPIRFIDGEWVYKDGTPMNKEERACTRCGKMPNTDGSDSCLGHIKGATSACCGHGKEKGYVIGIDMAKGKDHTGYSRRWEYGIKEVMSTL